MPGTTDPYNQHLHQLDVYTVEELLEKLEEEELEKLHPKRLARTSPHTIAMFLNRLSIDDCRIVLRKLPEIDASAVLAEMDTDSSAEIVSAMREWRALKLLEQVEPDDAADIISELDEPDRIRLLKGLHPEKAKKVRALLNYAPDTAGGVMTPNFICVNEDSTVDQAITSIRKSRDDAKHTTYVYVTDREKRLTGVLSMQELVLAGSKDKIKQLMISDIRGVCSPDEDREQVALKMADLNLLDLPVVDDKGRLLGIVEHDDVIDIIQKEATEDIQKMVGAGADEAIHDDIFFSLKRRSPWLIVNLITALVAALVVSLFRTQIEKLSLLAVFMSGIASLGGNTGAQTLAIAIRSLAVGNLEDFDKVRICINEGLKGILNGIIVGALASLVVFIFTKDLKMTFVVFLAMGLNMGIGGIAGAFIPIMLKKLGFDPAQSSSIFLTGLTDICGLLIFLTLGAWLLL